MTAINGQWSLKLNLSGERVSTYLCICGNKTSYIGKAWLWITSSNEQPCNNCRKPELAN